MYSSTSIKYSPVNISFSLIGFNFIPIFIKKLSINGLTQEKI